MHFEAARGPKLETSHANLARDDVREYVLMAR